MSTSVCSKFVLVSAELIISFAYLYLVRGRYLHSTFALPPLSESDNSSFDHQQEPSEQQEPPATRPRRQAANDALRRMRSQAEFESFG